MTVSLIGEYRGIYIVFILLIWASLEGKSWVILLSVFSLPVSSLVRENILWPVAEVPLYAVVWLR
jgi:hypothetical protein